MAEQRWMELVGGPLDGQRLNVTALSEQQIAGGFALIADEGGTWLGGRSLYDPQPGDDMRLYWSGDIP
jgi:hypothetical protein